jgi:raffinose/stachyose/melibiose transport system substrate-binding protein
MKKTVFVLVLAMILIGSGFAGGGSQPGGSSSGGGSQAITFLYGKDTVFDGFQAVIDAIQRRYNIRTNLDIHPGGTEGDNIIKTRLATGDMADIFVHNTGSLLQAINPERNVMDITNEPFAATLTDEFKRSASVNGRLYAVPSSNNGAGAILYNKVIYQQLGLSIPHTWADFIANCQRVQAAGLTGVIGSFRDSWTSQLFILGDQYNVKAAQPNFPAEYTANRAKYATNAVARRGFEKIAEVRPFLNRDFMATTYDQAVEMLALGRGAHWAIVTGALSAINSLYPDRINDIGVFGIPGDDPNNHGLTVWIANGICIYRNTRVPDLAKQWISYYVSPEGMGVYTSAQVPDGPFSIRGINLPSNVFPGVRDMQAYFDQGRTDVALEFESPVKGPNLEQICIEVFAGYTSPLDAAIAYDQDVQKQAVQLNLPGW